MWTQIRLLLWVHTVCLYAKISHWGKNLHVAGDFRRWHFYNRWRLDPQHSLWPAELIIWPLWTATERLQVRSQVQPHTFVEINLFLLLIQSVSRNISFENSKRTVTLTLCMPAVTLSSADNCCNYYMYNGTYFLSRRAICCYLSNRNLPLGSCAFAEYCLRAGTGFIGLTKTFIMY